MTLARPRCADSQALDITLCPSSGLLGEGRGAKHEDGGCGPVVCVARGSEVVAAGSCVYGGVRARARLQRGIRGLCGRRAGRWSLSVVLVGLRWRSVQRPLKS